MDITALQAFSCSISGIHKLIATGPLIGASSPSAKILISAIIILALIALVITIAVALRKWFYKEDNQAHGGFLLSDLRKMHEKGHLTDQELEAAKKMIIKQNQIPSESDSALETRPGNNDKNKDLDSDHPSKNQGQGPNNTET